MEETDFVNRKGKVFCFISGGSQGFGRAVAIAFSHCLEGEGSCIVLVARKVELLLDVKSDIHRNNPNLNVITISEDLGQITQQKAHELLTKAKGTHQFDQVILIHNVGSLGNISQQVDGIDNFNEIRNYFDLNVSSVFVLTAAFLKEFKEFVDKPRLCLVINVTSLAAIQPFQGWAQYCSAKAAREQYFKVLAEEFPSTTVLNYSPGPMETAMADQIMESALPQIQEWFKSAKSEGRLLSCECSANKLLLVLKRGNFKSGSRIDYYDDEPEPLK